jgi:hypothetical protein
MISNSKGSARTAFSCKKLMSLRGMLNDGDTQDDELRKHPEKTVDDGERRVRSLSGRDRLPV